MKFIVSKIDMPALTLPPGELMYSEMSLSGFSLSRNSSCATTRLAEWSLTGPDQEDDALAQQARVDVVGAFAAAGRSR